MEQLDEALVTLGEDSARLDSGERGKSIDDERLAVFLVETGLISRYQAEQLRVGRAKLTLGPYIIIDSIGQGGMGQVFKAEHTVMGRVVAVKVLPRHKSTPEAIASFTREIRAQAQLDHENLVRAFDAGHDGNVHFLVTEYVPGTDLRRLIRRQGRVSMPTAAAIISQSARGLDHAHNRGLIHRDVKPGNVLVTPEGHTKVSDLGLAGYFHEAEQRDTHGGKVVGTADYLAPEQITSPGLLSPASDIYSLGCTLYYAVTGKVPFPGGSVRDKARAHQHTLPLDPRRLNPELSDEFVEVIAEMMVKDAEKRIQTAQDVIARLAPWSEGAMPAAAREVAAAVPVTPAYIPSPPSQRPLPPMNDTEPNFLVQPAEEPWHGESPSQLSLGTQPVSAFDEETLPLDIGKPLALRQSAEIPPMIRWLVLIGITTAVVAMALVIIQLLFL